MMANHDIITKDNTKTIFKGAVSKIAKDECEVLDIQNNFEENNVIGCYREQVFDSFKIGYGTLNICEKCGLNFNFIGQSIEMIFVLDGRCLVTPNESSYFTFFNKNEHNLLYYSSLSGQFQLKKGQINLMRINFSVDFLNQFLPTEKKFKLFRKQLEKNKTGQLNRSNGQITHNMQDVISEILESQRSGFFRKIHMHALVLKLLLLQLDQFKGCQPAQVLNEEEEKIRAIKNYINSYYQQPLTLQKLSKKFGTNEFALKKGFKSVMGTTVFSYIMDLRMSKAKELLLDHKLPVSEVSEIIGYKNPQHFSTAFKKRFGVAPSKL